MATLLLVMLLNQGHWLSGRDNGVTVRWLADQAMPPATLRWELALGTATIARGQADLDAPLGANGKDLKIPVPPVRVRTPVQWRWQLFPRVGGKVIAEGVQDVYLYPDNQLDGIAREVGRKQVVVYDASGQLSALLDHAKVPSRRIDNLGTLATLPADLILVGTDQLDNAPFSQQPLSAAAGNGASVLLFRQTKATHLMAIPLQSKSPPERLRWRTDHPLLAGLPEGVIASWVTGARVAGGQLDALRIPADQPVLELAFWPLEQTGELPTTADALLAVETTGRGRVVFCQLPLGPWDVDPRSQTFLAGAIEYLLSPPQAILPLNQRRGPDKSTLLPPAATRPGHEPQGDGP